MPTPSDLPQDTLDRLMIESVGGTDLGDDKLSDRAALSVLTSYTFVGACA